MSMEELVQFLQMSLEQDFGYEDDVVIEQLQENMKELRNAKMDVPTNPARAEELPIKPFGLFVPPTVEQITGRRTFQSEREIMNSMRAARNSRLSSGGTQGDDVSEGRRSQTPYDDGSTYNTINSTTDGQSSRASIGEYHSSRTSLIDTDAGSFATTTSRQRLDNINSGDREADKMRTSPGSQNETEVVYRKDPPKQTTRSRSSYYDNIRTSDEYEPEIHTSTIPASSSTSSQHQVVSTSPTKSTSISYHQMVTVSHNGYPEPVSPNRIYNQSVSPNHQEADVLYQHRKQQEYETRYQQQQVVSTHERKEARSSYHREESSRKQVSPVSPVGHQVVTVLPKNNAAQKQRSPSRSPLKSPTGPPSVFYHNSDISKNGPLQKPVNGHSSMGENDVSSGNPWTMIQSDLPRTVAHPGQQVKTSPTKSNPQHFYKKSPSPPKTLDYQQKHTRTRSKSPQRRDKSSKGRSPNQEYGQKAKSPSRRSPGGAGGYPQSVEMVQSARTPTSPVGPKLEGKPIVI